MKLYNKIYKESEDDEIPDFMRAKKPSLDTTNITVSELKKLSLKDLEIFAMKYPYQSQFKHKDASDFIDYILSHEKLSKWNKSRDKDDLRSMFNKKKKR